MIKINGIYFDRKYSGEKIFEKRMTSRKPVISWSCTGGDGLTQAGYEIEIRDGEKTVYKYAKETAEQTFVYDGEPLPVDKELTVFVTVICSDGQKDTAESMFLCAGTLDAPWICAAEDRANVPVIFSKRIEIKKPVKSAYLYCCGIGYYRAEIDGCEVLYDDYAPAFSDYTKTCYYNVYEADDLKRTGFHDIEITVADGWRRISSAFVEKNLGGRKIEFDGVPCLSAEIRIYYEDGDKEIISTGEDWSYNYGHITYSNIYNGEHVDMTAVPTEKRAAALYDGKLGVRRFQTLQPVSFDRFDCVSCFKTGEGYVYDFGQNIAGYVRLCIPKLSRGDKVTLKYGEMLNGDGTIYTAPLREAECTDVFISGGDEFVFEPQFTFHGFRYVQISGLPYPNKDSITAYAVFSGIDGGPGFECGSPLVNRIHWNSYMTERDNMLSILSDCPQRDERMGWLNDATVRFEETPYNFDIGAMFPKIVRDVLDAQRENGMIGCTAPFIFGQLPADPVCSSFLIAAERAYAFTGNTDVIKEGFEGFERWEKVLLDRSDGYIVNYSYYGDWAGPSYACVTEEFACSAVTPGILMSTGYSYYNCKLLKKFAEILGYKEKALYYAELCDKIAAAFNEKWVNVETGEIECGSMGAYVFALWLGILPENVRPLAAKRMRDDLVEREYKFTTGNLTTRYLYDMLAEYGYINEAWTLLNRVEYPSIGFEINHGATTVWERFELKKNPDMNSHNHPMYAAVDYFLHAYLAGIKITGAGCTRISVKPYMPDGLCYCRDTVRTVLGDIEVRWTVEFGRKSLYLTVPFGMTADIDFCGVKKTVGAGSHVIGVDE